MSDQNPYTEGEDAYLRNDEKRLGRIATVGPDGTPHVVPVGMWSHNGDGTIEVRGFNFDQTKKFRDVAATGRAAFVVDDVASVDPWVVRGVEVRGPAEAVTSPEPMIRIHPQRIVSWGIESQEIGVTHARSVS